jgi:hypothetical protein
MIVIFGRANHSTLLVPVVDLGTLARLAPGSLDAVLAASILATRPQAVQPKISNRRVSTLPNTAHFRTKLAMPIVIGTHVLEPIQLSWVAARATLARADVRRKT